MTEGIFLGLVFGAGLLLKLFEHRLCASRKGKWLCWHDFEDVPGTWGEERECHKCEHRYVTSLAEY